MTLSPQRWIYCYRLADWEKYRDLVNINLHTRPFPSLLQIQQTEQIDELVNHFTSAIMDAQDRSVPKIKPKRYSLVLPSSIKAMIAEKHRLSRQLKRNPGLRAQISPQLYHLTNRIDTEIKQIRNNSFNNMLSNTPTDDQHRALFRIARFLKNRHQQMPPLKCGDNILITPPEKANALVEQFKQNHENTLETDNRSHTTFVNRSIDRFMQGCEIPPDSVELSSRMEVNDICKKFRNSKAPGSDRVHNSLLKQLPPQAFLFLSIIINACLRLSYFPRHWKHATVIPIKKPQKPSTASSSYRPISLLSAISKVLERVILRRLLTHLHTNSIIPNFQHGFRSGHSTTTQLNNVVNKIKTGFQQKLSTGMILIDIEKAFDRVWHNGLLHKLVKIRTPHYLIKVIASFLTDRTMSVKVQNSLSSTINIKFGVPQGAVLSPTLYNIYTYDAPTPVECEIAQYADDTAFMCTSRFAKVIVRNLTKTFKRYHRYFKLWKISVNNSKTQAIFFSKRRTKQLPQRPFIAGTENIAWNSPVKYLGLLLDSRLTFQQHIIYVSEKTFKAIKILYSLLNRKSKLNLNNKLLLHKVCLRPVMTYAAPIIKSVAKSHIQKLQVAQNKILRIIMNAPRYTRTADLHEELNIERIDELIDRLSDNFQTPQLN